MEVIIVTMHISKLLRKISFHFVFAQEFYKCYLITDQRITAVESVMTADSKNSN